MFKRYFEFVEDLTNRVNRFFIAAKQESPCHHNSFDGKKVVTCEQVTVVSDSTAGVGCSVVGLRPLVRGGGTRALWMTTEDGRPALGDSR